MATTIDTAKAHLVRQHGDITAIFTWIAFPSNAGDDEPKRALVLVPTYRKGAPWFVIRESDSWRYNEYLDRLEWFDKDTLELAGGPLYLDQSARRAASVLTMTESISTVKRIKDIIMEAIPDLCAMPCKKIFEPTGKKYGELKLMANGTQIGQEDIRIENEVPSYV